MKLNYCTECAAKLTKETETKYVCDRGHIYWNNPRAAINIILIQDGQALFSKRGIEPHKDKYDFPGGFLEYDENAYEAAVRELLEETGLHVDAKDLTPLHSTLQHYLENITVSDIVFVATKWAGTPQASDDVASVEWKPIEFIDTPRFAWDYSGLVAKLSAFLKN